MSNSPYATSMGPTGLDEYQQPGRTSVLAVLAVVSAILCLPGMGVLAILLGAISLSAIGRSKGRIEGRGAAISGIILGLITTVLWGAVAMGALQVGTYYFKNMVPAGDRLMQALAADDFDTVRAEMTEEAAEQFSDEQLAWFAAELEKHIGDIQGVTTSFDAMTRAFRTIEKRSKSSPSNNTVSVQSHNDDQPVPMLIAGSDAEVFAIFIFDQESIYGDTSTGPKIIDIAIILSDDEVLALRSGGPASSAAGQMNSGEISTPDAPALPGTEPDAAEPAQDEVPTS